MPPIPNAAYPLRFTRDPFDALIVSCAHTAGLPLVARDGAIRESGAVKVVEAGSFEDVLQTARALAKPGDAVVLSPACSSYDMFDNYEQRGREFKRLAAALGRSPS